MNLPWRISTEYYYLLIPAYDWFSFCQISTQLNIIKPYHTSIWLVLASCYGREDKPQLGTNCIIINDTKRRGQLTLSCHNVTLHHQYHHQETVQFQCCYKEMSDGHYTIIIDTKKRGHHAISPRYIKSTLTPKYVVIIHYQIWFERLGHLQYQLYQYNINIDTKIHAIKYQYDTKRVNIKKFHIDYSSRH